ncbi:MAG: hypothetical protein WB783_11815 [Arenicellales bacterium]
MRSLAIQQLPAWAKCNGHVPVKVPPERSLCWRNGSTQERQMPNPGFGTLFADWTFRLKRGLRGRLEVRRTRLYGIGTARSGTHSICAMFSENVCAAHEPQTLELINEFFAWHHGRISDQALTAWIRARDLDMALEVDVSWLNILILGFLIKLFQRAEHGACPLLGYAESSTYSA